MPDINKNTGPGWGDHNTPYGTIHSYTDPGSHTASGNGGSNSRAPIGPQTTIFVPGTKNYNGSLMTMCVTNLKNHEGFVNQMYLDTRGNVTVGVGHLLASVESALGLHFTSTHHQTGAGGSINDNELNASASLIRSEFEAVKNTGKRSSIHLSNDAVIQQCIKDVQTTETGLRGLYSGYDSFPNSAKTGLVDMAFNLGITKLQDKFTKFNAAVNQKDWNKAASESHRVGIQEERNQATAKNFQNAALGK